MTQAYFNGDFYDALELSNPGESPSVAPSKWQKVEIPKLFERYLVRRAYSIALLSDGQNDKASAEERAAMSILDGIAALTQGSTGNVTDHRAEVSTR